MKCDELKAFDVGLGQYCEDGSPCVVAFDSDQNPRLLNEKVYLKSDVDAAIAELKQKLENHRKWMANHPGYYTKEQKQKRKEKRENGERV